jgi:hypothetical protein
MNCLRIAFELLDTKEDLLTDSVSIPTSECEDNCKIAHHHENEGFKIKGLHKKVNFDQLEVSLVSP